MSSDNHNSPLVQTPENNKTRYIVTCRQHTTSQGWVKTTTTLFSFPQGTSTSFLWAKLRQNGNEPSSTATQTQACQFILFCNSMTYEQFSRTIHIFLYNSIFTEDLCTGVCSKPCCKTCRSKPCTLQRLLNRCRAGQQQYIDYLKLFIQYCVNIAYTKGHIS